MKRDELYSCGDDDNVPGPYGGEANTKTEIVDGRTVENVYPLGASPHSSFNLNRIRLACLVGCLEEYDNTLRVQYPNQSA